MLGTHPNDGLATALCDAECRLRLPKTQQDVCAIVARITLTIYGKPRDDRELLNWSEQMARGTFGEAYRARGEAQRLAWVDMCERALRTAIRDFAC